ncbi:MAG: glycerol kinase GlpK [Cyclobacteriaceae bacterium]|nr:glycerol kinase GlpK [Cyclobacteriaceae bacterium]
MKYIIALDQGTTSSRAVLFNESGGIVDITLKEFTQIFPKPGWVEHDPEEIWKTQYDVLLNLIRRNKVDPASIAALGITNQRETTVVWDKNSGEPVMNAIVWQDKRTADICEEMKLEGLEHYVRKNTGLVIDSYFSSTKIAWMLRNVEGLKEKASRGQILMGTIDTWLIWKLTNGKVHATDYSNASRTMLYNIEKLKWDDQLMDFLQIPGNMMPEVYPSSHHFGNFEFEGHKIPIGGVLGDQQAALFGQACFEVGSAKNTYGTGCFVLMNTGEKIHHSKSGLITTIAWGLEGKIIYALEGSIFIAGAAIQWLRDGLKLIDSAADSDYFARQTTDNEVFVVPAFAGLGAPYWDMYARGAIFGLTRDTGKNHIIKATLQSLAFQTKDVLDAMEKDSGVSTRVLKVDGGASANDYLMQFQADIEGVVVERPEVIESTAKGSAYMAGILTGLWKKEDILKNRKIDRIFKPELDRQSRKKLYEGWKKAVEKTMGWLKN